jgi:hypothetical protein
MPHPLDQELPCRQLHTLFPGKENGSLLVCTHWETDISKDVDFRWKVSASLLTIRAGSRKTN